MLRVDVGQPVEITPAEARELRECTEAMHSQTRHQRKGWFLEYMKAHARAHRCIQRIFRRAHLDSNN